MLQLNVTDERGWATICEARTFPFVIGRSSTADLQITSAGVWEEHASIRLVRREATHLQRFVIESRGESLLFVNGEVTARKEIAIADEISLGAARVLVSLAPARQTTLRWHEVQVWLLLLFVVLVEAVVLHLAR